MIAENLKKVALLIFIFIGLAHIISGLMVSNGYLPTISLTINRVLDIPFAMTALIYAFATLHTGIPETKRKPASMAFIAISILIFIILAYINFLVPDVSASTVSIASTA